MMTHTIMCEPWNQVPPWAVEFILTPTVIYSFGYMLCTPTAVPKYTVSQKSSHLLTVCNFVKS